MGKNKIIYWASTGLFSLLMLFSAGMYIFNNASVSATFAGFGYPTYLIYPLATAKILGVVAVLTRKVEVLKQFAYAGFLYTSLLGATAHFVAGDGMWLPAVLVIALIIVSYMYEKKI